MHLLSQLSRPTFSSVRAHGNRTTCINGLNLFVCCRDHKGTLVKAGNKSGPQPDLLVGRIKGIIRRGWFRGKIEIRRGLGTKHFRREIKARRHVAQGEWQETFESQHQHGTWEMALPSHTTVHTMRVKPRPIDGEATGGVPTKTIHFFLEFVVSARIESKTSIMAFQNIKGC